MSLPKICTCPTVPIADCPYHHQDACGSLAAMPCSAVIRQIPKTQQSQHALCDQISLLWAAANRLGLYDAADFIRPYMAGNMTHKPDQMTDKPLPNRFTCEICGEEYRRSSAKKQREEAPICPVCAKYKVYQEYVQPSTIPK